MEAECFANWTLILEYLKFIFSWPLIGGGLLFYSLKRFSPTIIKKMDRANRIQGPMDFIIEEQPTPPELPEDEKKEADNLNQALSIIFSQVQIHSQQTSIVLWEKASIEKQLKETNEKLGWMGDWLEEFIYKFALVFLKPRTIAVLHWINLQNEGGVEIEKIHDSWDLLLGTEEVNAIIDSLKWGWMIRMDGSKLFANYFGFQFIDQYHPEYKTKTKFIELFPELASKPVLTEEHDQSI